MSRVLRAVPVVRQVCPWKPTAGSRLPRDCEPERETTPSPDVQAAALLHEAQQEAARLLEEARQEAESLREAARQEGLSRARAETASLQDRWRSLIAATEAAHGPFLEQLATQAAELAFVVGERLAGEHLRVSPEAMHAVVREALQMIVEAQTCRVRLHPDDLPLVREALAHHVLSGPPGLELVSDAAIAPGGCWLDADCGSVDATWQARRDALLSALRARTGSHGGAPGDLRPPAEEPDVDS
ncbi:MAG: hypothetical protein HY320_12090 [Armatimonadetes bacterium]|nr:hypothetical protein [Armatimonadota bacterium]